MKWRADPRKAASNLKRHGVSFEEAVLVFADPLADIDDDSVHESGRFNIVGRPYPWARDLLFVVYVEVSEEEVRIISARHATKHERKRYEERAQ
jgi:uncharacterized DUF497 family protein